MPAPLNGNTDDQRQSSACRSVAVIGSPRRLRGSHRPGSPPGGRVNRLAARRQPSARRPAAVIGSPRGGSHQLAARRQPSARRPAAVIGSQRGGSHRLVARRQSSAHRPAAVIGLQRGARRPAAVIAKSARRPTAGAVLGFDSVLTCPLYGAWLWVLQDDPSSKSCQCFPSLVPNDTTVICKKMGAHPIP
jgi:hypothetical protein